MSSLMYVRPVASEESNRQSHRQTCALLYRFFINILSSLEFSDIFKTRLRASDVVPLGSELGTPDLEQFSGYLQLTIYNAIQIANKTMVRQLLHTINVVTKRGSNACFLNQLKLRHYYWAIYPRSATA